MLDAYRGSVDDSGETLDDARSEIQRTFAGDYGRFDPDTSLLLEKDRRLAAAVLITRYEDSPFVSFCMTAPAFKRRGLCRALMHHVACQLYLRGETQLKLVVTAQNTPALRLYQSLGFAIS